MVQSNFLFFLSQPNRQVYFTFVIILAVAPLFWAPMRLLSLWRVAQDPASDVGIVTARNCLQHGRVAYEFHAAGAKIFNDSHGVEGVDCYSVQVGQRVNVSYQRANPSNNYAFAIDDVGENRVRIDLWFGVVGALAFIFALPAVMTFSAKGALRLARRLGFA